MQSFLAADSSSTTYALNGTFDPTGEIFTPANSLAAGAQVGTTVVPGIPVNRSIVVPAASALPLMGSNANRKSITFQVPSGAPGIWVNWIGPAGVGTSGSFFFLPGTQLVSLDVSVVGTGPISIYSPTGGFLLPATEC